MSIAPVLTPKQQALRDLEIARADLARSTVLLTDEWSPKAVISRSLEKYRGLWIGGAAVAGLAAMKWLLPSAADEKNTRRGGDESRSGGLAGLLKLPLLFFGKKAVMNYGLNLVQSVLQRRAPESANESPPRAVS